MMHRPHSMVHTLTTFGLWAGLCVAQETTPAPAPPPMATASASELVRYGNRLLLDGKPTDALDTYHQAKELEPDAREIAFVEGLGHYQLGQYDEAREAFHQAAGTKIDSLADDALYSAATCDHAEALGAGDDPKVAIAQLEDAMQAYHSVLERNPDHEAARDANFKAASVWRQLKRRLEQQQQQEQSDQEGDDEENEEKQERQQPDSDESSDDQKEKDGSQEQEDQDQKQSDSNEQQEQSPKEQQAKEQKERVSREQAERKLREMMQAMRDRKKTRRKEVQQMPVAPTAKDW